MSQFVPIQLDKVRNLKIGIKASKIIQDELQKPLMEVFSSMSEGLDINTLICIVYAGLVHEDKSLTKEKVLDLLDEHSSIEEVADKIAKAVEVAFKTEKSNEGK
jgi:hypothetical protein